VALVGVGNALLGDDGAGPALIHRMKGRLEGRSPAFLVDGGEAPETYWGRITAYQPHAVLVIDAVDWGGDPESVAFLEEVGQRGHPCSTHRIPLNLFLWRGRGKFSAPLFP
jgi:hydrogenase maturation protease